MDQQNVPASDAVAAVVPIPGGPVTILDELPTAAAAQPSAGGGPWSVGTLTYTTAGLVTLFSFLLWGDFALAMRERSIPQITAKMLGWFHASNRTFALLTVSLPPAVALLVVPVVSYKSDRLRSRWGRRIPYLLASTPVAAACMVALAFSADLGGWTARATGRGSADGWSLAYFGLFWTAFECAALTTVSLFTALVGDVVPRPLLGRFYGLFRAVSLSAGMLFNFVIFPHATAHYRGILIALAAVFGVGFTIMCLNVREGEYPPPPPATDGGGGRGCNPVAAMADRLAAVRRYLAECFRHRYYLCVFAAITLGAITFVPVNGYSLWYAKQLGLSDTGYGRLLTLTYGVSLALAWPLGWVVDRRSALVTAAACIVAYAVAMLVGGLGVQGARSFGVVLIIHGVLSGAYFTASASLAQVLLPRLKFGQFASAQGIVQSLATVAAGPIMGQVLDWTNNAYRLTFFAGGLLAVGAAACLFAVRLTPRPADDDTPLPSGFPVLPVAGRH